MAFQTFYNNPNVTDAEFKKHVAHFLRHKKDKYFRIVLNHYKCEDVLPTKLEDFKASCEQDPTYRKRLVLLDSVMRDYEQVLCEGVQYDEYYKMSLKYIHIYDYTDEFAHISEFADCYAEG
jgi:hypothetical protein